MRPLLVVAALVLGTACAGANAGTATDTPVTTVSTLYGRPPVTYLPAGSPGLELRGKSPYSATPLDWDLYYECVDRFGMAGACALGE